MSNTVNRTTDKNTENTNLNYNSNGGSVREATRQATISAAEKPGEKALTRTPAAEKTKVIDVIEALDQITGGRVIKGTGYVAKCHSPFVVTKSSNIPGKAITETPGLVFGNPEAAVEKLAVSMTLTESQIELCYALEIDGIICHHPIADAANSGGVPLKSYLSLYNISAFELHEAFHGLHPGLAYIHGHKAFRVDISYGGLPGNIVNVGHALPEVRTVKDIVDRLSDFAGLEQDICLLEAERNLRGTNTIQETNACTGPVILNGAEDSPVNTILHIFPHTGFTVSHLEQALKEHPDIDTIIASISRVRPDHPIASAAREKGLNFVCGNTHALEIFENGLPLAFALQKLLPGTEVFLFRERVTSTPVSYAGNKKIREYSENIADQYLIPERR